MFLCHFNEDKILETHVSDNWSMHVRLVGENLAYVQYYYNDLYAKKMSDETESDV